MTFASGTPNGQDDPCSSQVDVNIITASATEGRKTSWKLGARLNDEPLLDQSNFSRLRQRRRHPGSAGAVAVGAAGARADGSGMRNWKGQRRGNVTHVRATDPQANLMRTEHITVDGSLIDALASLKSLKPRGGGDRPGSQPQRRTEDKDKEMAPVSTTKAMYRRSASGC